MGLALLKIGRIEEAKQANYKVKLLKQKLQNIDDKSLKSSKIETSTSIKEQGFNQSPITTIQVNGIKSENFEELRRKYENGELSLSRYQELIKGNTKKRYGKYWERIKNRT